MAKRCLLVGHKNCIVRGALKMYYLRQHFYLEVAPQRLGDWIMRDSEGNPVDTKFLEIVDAARQEGYAQGWKDAVTNMITAANNMQHPKMDVRDAATVSNPLPVAAHAAHAAQAGGLLTNSPGG